MRKLLLLPFLYVLFVAGSCESEIRDPLDLEADYAYFPLELNQPLFYDQDSIVVFNTTAGIVYDTSRSEIRETLVEMLVEADGSETYRGERWQRADENTPWQFIQTYTISRSTTAAVRREDNLQFTKLVFPIRNNESWDGNSAFDVSREIVVGGEFLDVFNGWDYRYQTMDSTFTSNSGQHYADAVVVEQASVDDNLIDQRIAYEIYAPNVGLVERFIDARHTQCRVCCRAGNDIDFDECFNLPWDEKAEKGFVLRQRLK